jgi:hypothetical protein
MVVNGFVRSAVKGVFPEYLPTRSARYSGRVFMRTSAAYLTFVLRRSIAVYLF